MRLAAVAALSLACAAAPPAPPTAPATGFERAIAPFEVTGFELPFLGGFDVPRPQFIDIDADGDLDLFVQERSNELMHFENTGTPALARYQWRSDRYEQLDIGEWSRFVDIDQDGDFDLLAETPFSYIRLYRNDGSRQRAKFTLAADSVRDQDGKAIFSDRQNIPQIVDLDCDRLMDLFIGKVEGTITHYEEIPGSRAAGTLRFGFDQDRWEGIEIVAAMGPGADRPSLHGANTMFFADADRDGDLDLYWGDFFEDGVLLIENQGSSCAQPSLRSTPVPIMQREAKLSTSGYNVPFLADIDADRDLDLFVGILGGAYNPNKTAADNFYFLRAHNGAFTLEQRRFISTIDLGSESIPALADLDADGDLDLVAAPKLSPHDQQASKLFIFRNTGTKNAPRFALQDSIALAPAYHYAPAFADLDGDRDLDLVLGTWNNGVQFYRNERGWVQDTARTLQLTRGSNAVPALGDLDGDGDLDLLVGEASGELNYYRNGGGSFELVSETFQSIDPGRRSHPLLTDYDGDGDLDLLMGMEAGAIALYRNTGTKQEPRFGLDDSFKLATPPMSAPALGDLNGDGRPELIVGVNSGGLLYFTRR